jgi:hypothetical protein
MPHIKMQGLEEDKTEDDARMHMHPHWLASPLVACCLVFLLPDNMHAMVATLNFAYPVASWLAFCFCVAMARIILNINNKDVKTYL